jgi:hypothetical protein
MLAAANGHINIVHFLVEAGANKNINIKVRRQMQYNTMLFSANVLCFLLEIQLLL